jgi:uncharacterized protein
MSGAAPVDRRISKGRYPMRNSLPGKFIWFELETSDAPKAQAFFADVLRWTTRSFPAGPITYEMIFAGDTMVGSYASATGGARWLSCVSVPDLDAAIALATANGGTCITAISVLPAVGRRATITDPQGAPLCLFERVEDDKPDGPDAKPGEFFWNELHTTDPRAAVAFYAKLIGYTHETMGDYYVLSSAGAGRGGVTGELTGAPHWLPYVMTDDVDATMARVPRAGGSIAVPPMDIPGIGRFAVMSDPTGARLAVMKPIPPATKH